jgi:hypothetical protein
MPRQNQFGEKQRIMQKLLSLTLLLSLFLVSCEQETNIEDYLIQGGVWKLSKQEFQDAGQSTWTTEPISACDADDTYTFNENGSFEFFQGSNKCDASTPTTQTGAWSVSNTGKTLTFPVHGVTLGYTIEDATDSKVVLIADFLGDKVRETYVPK